MGARPALEWERERGLGCNCRLAAEGAARYSETAEYAVAILAATSVRVEAEEDSE